MILSILEIYLRNLFKALEYIQHSTNTKYVLRPNIVYMNFIYLISRHQSSAHQFCSSCSGTNRKFIAPFYFITQHKFQFVLWDW